PLARARRADARPTDIRPLPIPVLHGRRLPSDGTDGPLYPGTESGGRCTIAREVGSTRGTAWPPDRRPNRCRSPPRPEADRQSVDQSPPETESFQETPSAPAAE